MKRSVLLFTLGVVLASCGEPDVDHPPGPATFGDATVDVGKASDAARDGLLADAAGDGLLADAGCTTCVGATMPTWQLADFQPKSAGYGKTYGLEAFKGKVTVVALLASW